MPRSVIDSGQTHLNTVDPTVNDDFNAGYDYGSEWLNTVTDTWWKCQDPTIGSAVWERYVKPAELNEVKDNGDGTNFVASTMNNYALYQAVQGLPGTWTDTVDPTPDNDGVDTAGLGHAFAVGDFWVNTATERFWVCVDNSTGAAVWYLLNEGTITNEPTGFQNRTDSTISFADGTLTFTIAPAAASFEFFVKGVRVSYSSAQDVVITDTEGIWYFYFDKDTYALTATQTFTHEILTRHAYVSVIYWDATNKTAISLGDERHAFMPGVTHLILHNSVHTQYLDGLELEDFTFGDGSLDAHAQFGYAAGTIADEDILFSIAADAVPAVLPIFHKDGASGYWRKDTADNFPLKNYSGGSGLAAFNEWTGSTWQQTEVGDGNYVLSFVAATNDPNQPMVVFQGRREYESITYATLFARTEAYNILSELQTLPFRELRMVGAVIYETSTTFTNTVKSRVVQTSEGDDYVDLSEVVLLAGDVLRLRTVRYAALSSSVAEYGGRPCVKMTANATNTFGVAFPAEAVEIVGLYGIVTAEATVSGVDIDLTSTYNALNEPINQHQESDTSGTYDFTADVMTEMNLSGVFVQASAGDTGGITIDHNGIGTTAYYFYFRVDFLAY